MRVVQVVDPMASSAAPVEVLLDLSKQKKRGEPQPQQQQQRQRQPTKKREKAAPPPMWSPSTPSASTEGAAADDEHAAFEAMLNDSAVIDKDAEVVLEEDGAAGDFDEEDDGPMTIDDL